MFGLAFEGSFPLPNAQNVKIMKPQLLAYTLNAHLLPIYRKSKQAISK